MNKFEKLGLSEKLLKSIADCGFEEPTEIQEKTIPEVIAGNDIIAGSATGSGKTLAFAAGIIQNNESIGKIQSIILTPTRELAEQVADSIISFGKYRKLKVTKIYGGVSINPQIHDLTKSDVVVGTPGRILDHISRKTMDLSHCRLLILDEADRMLDMGFIDDVKKIMSQCPKDRQTLMFSATLPPGLERLAERYMNNPKKISAVTYVDPKLLNQIYYNVKHYHKLSLLVHLLKQEDQQLVMVFCNARFSVDFVVNNLVRNDVKAKALHGGFSQDKRTKALKDFTDESVRVLVCTDVAARGLDIPNITHVYNYDIPDESKQYVHRIGRTARAGEAGMAINLLSDADHDNLNRIFRDYDVTIEKIETPEFKILQTQHPTRHGKPRPGWNNNGNRGGPRRGGRPGGNRGGPHRGGPRRSGPRSGGHRSSSRGGSHRSSSRESSSSSDNSRRPAWNR